MKIDLNKIAIDAGTQARACIDPDTVSDYAERMTEGDVFPPVVIFHDGNHHYIGDGFHRILASARIQAVDIEADIRKGTWDDALWYALGANRENGVRMKRGDVRHAVELALKTWPDKTQQAIADQVGCSQRYVGKVQEELSTCSKLDIPATRTGADGKERPTTYKRREPEQQQQEVKRKPSPPPPRVPSSVGMQYASMAIDALSVIPDDDTEREEALDSVVDWISKNIQGESK